MIDRRLAATVVIAAATILLVGSTATGAGAGPTLWTFPGGCKVNTAGTLQECIDNATAGDKIEIAVDGPILEFIEIRKSLTVRAAGGHHPSIDSGAAIRGTAVSGTVAVSFVGVSFGDLVEADFTGGTGHSLTIRDGTVTSDVQPYAIVLDAAVPSRFDLSGLRVRSIGQYLAGPYAGGVILLAHQGVGTVHLRLVGNRISGRGNPKSGSGIAIYLSGSGSTTADLHGNAVVGFGTCGCLRSSGLLLEGQGTVQAHVNLVGDTFAQMQERALYVLNDLAAGGHLDLDLFDDIFSDSARAIEFDSGIDATLKVRAGTNDYFANSGPDVLDGNSLGHGNLHVAPRYLDLSSGDVRLKADSQLIDRGLVCTPGGVARVDAAGHARLSGPTVDIGAHERGAGPPTGSVVLGGGGDDMLTGTPGQDILCGYGGGDRLDGRGGADYLDGGAGPDRLIGRGGPDTLCARDGVHGNDHLDGGPGTDGYRADAGDARTAVEHLGHC